MYRYKTAQEFRRALAALGTDAADCKRELAELVLSMQSGAAPGTQSASPGSTTKATAAADVDSSYAQTFARLATTKRERRAATPIVPPAIPLPAPIPVTPFPPIPAALPAPQAADARIAPGVSNNYLISTPPRPGILTALCIMGITVATFGLGGLLINWHMLSGIKPSPSDAFGGPRLWSIVLTAINAILIALLFTGSIAALRLARWARPIWLAYIWAEFPLQLLIAIIGLHVAVPRILEEMRAHAQFASPQQAEQVILNVKISLTVLLVLRCVLACAFATAAAIVVRRPSVKLALREKQQ
ncbi:MAG: hypothetical protein JWP03_1562 [Phycisphaerales bacterium]|nr:hypothetical protein [Phycisphaerales bacterium]